MIRVLGLEDCSEVHNASAIKILSSSKQGKMFNENWYHATAQGTLSYLASLTRLNMQHAFH